MKKISIVAIALLFAAALSAGAQGMEDALRYSQQYYVGSARTMAMGNAFTALGGDLGAMSINPASTALYNCCEFAITGGWTWDRNDASFLTTEGTYSQSKRKTTFTIPNISMAFSMPTGRDYGLVNYSFGFGFNKISNFNSRISFRGDDSGSSLLGNIADGLEGVDNSYLLADDAFNVGYCTNQEILAFDAYLVNPYHNLSDSYIGATENEWTGGGLGVDNILDKSYDRIRSGGIYDMAFNFGMNFSDKLYLGANLNINMVDFKDDLCYTENGTGYSGNYFQSGFKSMEYDYWQETSGVGVNLQLGAIWVPFDFLRLGVSCTTPTIYQLTDTWREAMVSDFAANSAYKSVNTETDVFSYDYRVEAPGRVSLGAAIVFGHSGLISIDCEKVNYSKTRMSDYNHNYDTFKDVNNDLSYVGSCKIVRVGAEMNIVNDYVLRGGYAGYIFNAPQYQYVSFGIGKRIGERSSIDVAFRTSLPYTYSMTPYDDYAYDSAGEALCMAPTATITNVAKDLLFTYRVKF